MMTPNPPNVRKGLRREGEAGFDEDVLRAELPFHIGVELRSLSAVGAA
jgi:hypothetical protein